jgi:hypothetical protein
MPENDSYYRERIARIKLLKCTEFSLLHARFSTLLDLSHESGISASLFF